jgi:hypothetical protein
LHRKQHSRSAAAYAITRCSSNHSDTDRSEFWIEQVRAVRRRMHPARMNHLRRRTFRYVLRDLGEARSGNARAILQRARARNPPSPFPPTAIAGFS